MSGAAVFTCSTCSRRTEGPPWELKGAPVCQDCARVAVLVAAGVWAYAPHCPAFDGSKCRCGNNGGGDCCYCSEIEYYYNNPDEVQGVSFEQFRKDCHPKPRTPRPAYEDEQQAGWVPEGLLVVVCLALLAWASCHPVPQPAPLGPSTPPALASGEEVDDCGE